MHFCSIAICESENTYQCQHFRFPVIDYTYNKITSTLKPEILASTYRRITNTFMIHSENKKIKKKSLTWYQEDMANGIRREMCYRRQDTTLPKRMKS